MLEQTADQTAAQETEAQLTDMFSNEDNQEEFKEGFRDLDFETKLKAFVLIEALLHDFSHTLGLEAYRQLRLDVEMGLSAEGAVQINKGVDKIKSLHGDQVDSDLSYGMLDMCVVFGVMPRVIRRWVIEGKIPHPDISGSIYDQDWRERWRVKAVLDGIEEMRKIRKKGLRSL